MEVSIPVAEQPTRLLAALDGELVRTTLRRRAEGTVPAPDVPRGVWIN